MTETEGVTKTGPADPVVQTTYRGRTLTVGIDGATYQLWVDGEYYHCAVLAIAEVRGGVDMRDPANVEPVLADMRGWIDEEQRLRELFPVGSTVQSVPHHGRHGVRCLAGVVVRHKPWTVWVRVTETNYTAGEKSRIGAEVPLRLCHLQIPGA